MLEVVIAVGMRKGQEGVYESQKANEMRMANIPEAHSRVARKGEQSEEGVLGKTRSTK
jgi:hypothetical protein